MAIRKVKGLESSFSILPNHTINAPLSWSAKGLLAYLLSKPDDWSVSVTQLINHSNLSSRPTKRDGTYAIINELMEKGYIQRERTSGGGYSKTEYTVSSIPMEVKPLTDNPVLVEPTLQRTDLNKEHIKDTDSFSSNKEDVFLEQLFREEFPHCYKAIEQLKQYRDTYTGKLSLDEWLFCEGQMASVDFDCKYIHWWMEDKAKSFTKKPSLPNLLCDMNGIEFSDYYSKVEDNF